MAFPPPYSLWGIDVITTSVKQNGSDEELHHCTAAAPVAPWPTAATPPVAFCTAASRPLTAVSATVPCWAASAACSCTAPLLMAASF